MQQEKYHILILAGSRAGGDPFAQKEGKTQKIFLEAGGQSLLSRVLETIGTWPHTASITLSLPEDSPIKSEDQTSYAYIQTNGILQVPTAYTPCTSLLKALETLRPALNTNQPVLVLTADAPLLSHKILDEFTTQNTHKADFIAGVAKVDLVEKAYPDVKRTRIRLKDGHIGGCNLFILNNTQALGVIAFWKTLENNRKKPWRLAATFKMLILYALGWLTSNQALKELGKKTKCTLGFAYLKEPHAAIDVDKVEDLNLVRRILEEAQ